VALTRLALAWLLVSAWFVLWEMGTTRLVPAATPGPRRGLLRLLLVEALVVSMFASLWFASLGHGGWVLLFLLLGLLIEAPARFRDDAYNGRALPATFDLTRARWIRIGLGVFRTVVAGGLLVWAIP
jgi:hypothetical protein